MEHACGQCGAAVEDGRPFCENCHAPQIKVPVRPPTAPATEPLPPGTPEDLQPPAEPIVAEPRRLEPILSDGSEPQNKLIWRPAIGAALVAGLLATLGTLIPAVPLIMLCMFASGGLAVTLYRRRAGNATVTPIMGAKLGALAGGWGFGLQAVLITAVLSSPSQRTKGRDVLLGVLRDAAAKSADPNASQMVEKFQGYIATDLGLVVVFLMVLAILALLFLAFSALGGALGAALFGRDSSRKE